MDILINHGSVRPANPDTTHAVAQFLYLEADLLDEWRFEEWLELLAEDLHYWAPTRENRVYRERRHETAAPGGSAYFEETRADMVQRVERLHTHMAWAEDPPSRTRHLVTNVRAFETDTTGEYAVSSDFVVYRTRSERDQDHIVGQRRDVLRIADHEAGFELARREIRFDMATLLIKNLSSFF
jgi:3-phenylpropionate/cinnamic acid dioxygenase small subunit